jgi:two-component system, cell cycle response regulator DivK
MVVELGSRAKSDAEAGSSSPFLQWKRIGSTGNEAGGDAGGGGNERAPLILLVEDNETIRRAVGILLEESGYRVTHANSGSAALENAEADPPDLVLMDLGLPDVNGLEVTRRLKANPTTRQAVVVALTGRALDSDAAACRAAGCAAYLAKPVDTHKLLKIIPELLATSVDP